jgi:hypothetical protein
MLTEREQADANGANTTTTDEIQTGAKVGTPRFRRRPFVADIPADLVIVYVITVNLSAKIGWTGDIKERLRKIRTHAPGEPMLRHCCVVPRPSGPAVERRAHELLADKRFHGEWFACKIDEAVAAVEQARIALGIPVYGEVVRLQKKGA